MNGARKSAYCLLLMTVRGDDGGEETAYVAVPAAKFRGQEAVFAPWGTKAPSGSVETGRLVEDAAALAGRIAERVRTV